MSAATTTAASGDGSLLWLRMWKLTVGTQGGGQAVDLSDLAFEFAVEMPSTGLTRATITIFNADPDTLVAALQKEYTVVRLEAGYTPPSQQYGLLFQGEIAYFRYGRRDALDSFIEIVALTGDPVHTLAVANTTLPAGHTKRDEINALVEALKPYGITLGQVTELGNEALPRARTLFGPAPAVLRDLAQSAGAYWHVDSLNRLHILKPGEALESQGSGGVPVLNTSTGMVDVPVVTIDGGVDVKCLLNPSIRPYGRIQVDQKKLITQYGLANDNTGTGATGMLGPQGGDIVQAAKLGIHGDGYYVVWSVTHTGQNRGNPWYSHIVTQPLKAPGSTKS